MPHIIMERPFESPLDPKDIPTMVKDGAGCLDIYQVVWAENG